MNATSAAPEMSRRRRIVHHGLYGLVPEPVVRRAVELCDREFPPPQPFSIQRFLKRLVELEPGLAPEQGRAFRTLLPLLNLDAEAIGGDPLNGAAPPPPPRPRLGEGRAAAAAAPVRQISRSVNGTGADGWLTVFNALMDELVYLLASQDRRLASQVKAQLRLQASKLGLTPAGQAELSRWNAAADIQPFAAGLVREDMSKILHMLYMWTCTAVGPAEADQFFARAVRAAEQLPEAGTCPPRSLL